MAGATEAFSTAGTTISASASAPATINAAGYGALTYTLIGEVEDGGSVGRAYNTVQFAPVADRATRKLKGSFNDGTMDIKIGFASGDAGQIVLAAGLDDDAFYSFKIVLQDGTFKYFQAQIVALPTLFGGVDSVVESTLSLAVKSGTIITAFLLGGDLLLWGDESGSLLLWGDESGSTTLWGFD